jgi:protein-tyrosine phosphatase
MSEFPERAQNLRSLGGIPAADGKRIREGTVFRGGDIGGLTDACRRRMSALGIRAVVDLRSASERRKRPYDWGEDRRIDVWGHPKEFSDSGLREMIGKARGTPEEVTGAMRRLYSALPSSHAPSYATLFQWLSHGRVPLLFTCAAGKDRTGVAAALLLWALGADREVIMADYLRSNEQIGGLEAIVVNQFGWDPRTEQVQAVLTADAAYLNAMFDRVETQWGGVEAYLAEMLDIDGYALERLRSVLLEEPV